MSNKYEIITNKNQIHLNETSNINCNFSNNYLKNLNNKTFTWKDHDGITVIKNIILILFLFYLYYKKKDKIILYVIILLTLNFYFFIKKEQLRLIYPFSYLISTTVNTPPYLNIDKYFPAHKQFEEKNNFQKIKKEVNNLIKFNIKNFVDAGETFDGKTNKYIGGGKYNYGNNWKSILIYAGNNFTILAEKKCPTLCNIIRNNKKNVVSVLVSLLPAKRAIPIHVGYYKGVIRYQLGINIPKDRDNVFICVNGEKYSWKEGEGVLFDDIYPHKVYNNTNEDRVIIYVDVIRPFKSKILNNLNKFLINLSSNSKAIKDELKRTEYQVKL